ncbi:MAG: hypothetical protein MUF58_05355 [Arcicella sp.]|jgi:hypothetical protein|nr:hypothetical protein [Arcicella sp.]
MKKYLLLLLLLGTILPKIKAQDSLRISSRLDSFPTIKIKKNITLQILGVYPTMAWFMGASCNDYIIGKKKYLNPTPMKPYFDELGDNEVLNHYQQHRDLKPAYFTGYGAGLILYIYGISKNISKVFSNQTIGQPLEVFNNGKTEIYTGLGIILAATVVRVISFSHLRKATKRYNQLITNPKTAFDIKPSQDGLGLGLRMSF